MEDIRATTKKVYLSVIAGAAFVGFLYLWFLFFGFVIGIILFALVTFCLATWITKFVMFPGSFILWRRWWQAGLEGELTRNFIDHLHELKYAAELLLQNTSTISHIKKNSIQLHESLEIFSVIISNYNTISANDLNKYQIQFQSLINSIHKTLNETVLVFPKQSENFWNVLNDSKIYDWSNVTFDDFPENVCLKNTIEAFDNLERFLNPMTDFRFPHSLIFEGVFTNLDILRLILQSSCTCEQYWVTSEDGEVDCILARNFTRTVDAPVMIFCNPNGGLYEYACYQNHWLDFYINNGIDLCLWNYRGYGRTKGTPSSNSLKTDAQAIYDFLSKVKMYQKIGIHGESIGGMVASYIGSKNPISFLFTDRTFCSLPDLVHSRIRPLNKYVFKCLSRWEDNTMGDFVSAECYKVLSCDPNDEIIPEKASLKGGIAFSYNCNDLDNDTLCEFSEAIVAVCGYVSKFKPKELASMRDSRESNFESTHNSMYILVGNQNENQEDESTNSLIFKLYNALEIDAGGSPLIEIKSPIELSLWIRVLQLWGSYLPIGTNALGKDKALQKLKSSIDILTEVFRENEFVVNTNVVSLCRQARLLKNGLTKVLKCFENYNRSVTEELTIRDEDGNEISQYGYLIPVACGHNGKFTEEEKSLLVHHLKQAKLLN